MPVEKSLNLVVKEPKTTVIRGKAAPHMIAHTKETPYMVHIKEFAYWNTFYATRSALESGTLTNSEYRPGS